jgi:hypothetical protein
MSISVFRHLCVHLPLTCRFAFGQIGIHLTGTPVPVNFFDHHDLKKPYKTNQARNTLKPKTLFKAGRNQFIIQTTNNLRQTD